MVHKNAVYKVGKPKVGKLIVEALYVNGLFLAGITMILNVSELVEIKYLPIKPIVIVTGTAQTGHQRVKVRGSKQRLVNIGVDTGTTRGWTEKVDIVAHIKACRSECEAR